MYAFLNLSELTLSLLEQYQYAISKAFPPILQHSKVFAQYWKHIEQYFPEQQLFLVNSDQQLIGFFNTIPFHFDQPLTDLPNNGWDWMVKKGIHDFESGQSPNALGGLQVIITKEFLGKGYSKVIIQEGKQRLKANGIQRLIIPIRPIFKHQFPHMEMKEYMAMTQEGQIYDPWIRTHLKGGAEILKVCSHSMHVEGDLKFWEALQEKSIFQTGEHLIKGALNPVYIDVQKNYGEYWEENIWIHYPGL